MRFTLMAGLGGIEDYPDLAVAAEDSGWTSFAVPDSLFYPEVTGSDYPYMSTEAVRQALDGMPVLEPFVAMASLVALTQRLRFFPAVMKVPVRQPLVFAKALSSLAVISGNRVALGAGLSPWQEDFSYNGVEFAARGVLMDECIAIIRGAMSGEYFELHSDHFDIGRMKLSPAPTEPVPILVGGHAKPALRRAARLGDGWISANSDFGTLESLITSLQDLRVEYGTDGRQSFEIHAFDMTARTLDDYQRLAALGVTDMSVTPWNPADPSITRDQKVEALQEFAKRVIQAYPQ